MKISIKKFNLKKIAIITTGVVLLLAAGYGFMRYQALYPSTDDAYVQANIVNIAAQVTGPVSHIAVTNHQFVSAGQPLFDIDPTPFQLAVNKAQAQLALATQQEHTEEDAVHTARANVALRAAQFFKAERYLHRALPLVKNGSLTKNEGDVAISQYNGAKATLAAAKSDLHRAQQHLGTPGERNAEIQQAKAQLARAQLDLQHTHITAPDSGYLTNFNLRQGAMIAANQPLFVLVENQQWWVNANFKETALRRIRPGQTATVILDMYPHHKFKGVVASISPGSGAVFSLLPPENATGNWVKVTQRFPVRVWIINPDPHFPLRVGASSKVTIDTTTQPTSHS